MSMLPAAVAAILTCQAIDGDTLRCGRELVRIVAIDAAETPKSCRRGRPCRTEGWQAAKAALARLVEGRPVRVERQGVDRHGRTVARVTVGGVDVGCAQVTSGHARYWRYYDRGDALRRSCPALRHDQSPRRRGRP